MKAITNIWAKVPLALFTDPAVKPSMIHIYAVLATFQGGSEFCYPSRKQIAERANLSERAVSGGITALVEAGWIVRKRRGLKKTNVYLVLDDVDLAEKDSDCDVQEMFTLNAPDVQTCEKRCAETVPILPYIEKNTYKKNTLNMLDPTVPADEEDSKRFKKEIKEAFETQGKFANYAREGAAIKRIEQLARQDFAESWELYGKKMVAEFWRLREQDPFMGKQPFLPSVLSSGGIWPRVKMGLEKELKEAQEYARLEKMYIAKK